MAIKSKIKGKKKHKNKPTSVKYKKYKIENDAQTGISKIVEKAKSCPRCGPGVFLSVGKGRSYCGKCHFTGFDKIAKKE